MNAYQAVLFDLDGTLVDTAPDLGFALNTLLEQENYPRLTDKAVRTVASNGSQGLIKLGFNIDADHIDFPKLQQRFIALYQSYISRQSSLFRGMEQVLSAFEASELPWGIVTNKPEFLTYPLLQQIGLFSRSQCIVSGDTTPYAKPHPEPLLHACRLLSVTPEKCLYIGDAERDIIAGNAANMTTLVASYGYLEEKSQAKLWPADGYIDKPEAILDWLASRPKSSS